MVNEFRLNCLSSVLHTRQSMYLVFMVNGDISISRLLQLLFFHELRIIR